ncbi:winged helix-turn-helix domain-containing protein, partial [Bradyrhizobium sp.]|uniref:winged helix-turn-helix domain-containing protein n=1 Tax=Bradyrhizobium sp. TaxID=376 RepID=UPI003C53C278
ILRRAGGAPARAVVRRYAFDRFVVDMDARSIELVGAEAATLQLTSAEFDLLGCFLQRPRRVLSRDQILDFTRGRSSEPFDRTVDMMISRLRKKLDAASPGSNLITTVRNGGYLFTASVKQVT